LIDNAVRHNIPGGDIQVGTATSDGGHGLGLSIVKAIATAHAATITASPRPGGGLTIEITFPPPSTTAPASRRAVSRGDAQVPAAVRPES
jgi:signal transduction histidine kinase